MPITHRELVDLYGESGVLTADRGDLAALGIPSSSAAVLETVGLPFAVDNLFVALPAIKLDLLGVDPRYCRIGRGWYESTEMCIDTHDGRVVALTVEPGEPPSAPVFVNQTAALFVEFLYRSGLLIRAIDTLSPDETVDIATSTKQYLRELEPAAVADYAWWSAIVDEMTMI
jgi:hypothetical protein